MGVADGTPVELTSKVLREPMQGVVQGGAIEFALDIPPATKAVRVDVASLGKHFGIEIPVEATRGAAWRTIAAIDAKTQTPIVDAVVMAGDSVLAHASPTGSYGFASEQPVRITAPGYLPADIATGTRVALTPWFDGALHGKRFVIDPQGGPPATVGVGPMGLSAAFVNLRVAVYLEGFLRAAGADVRLSRTDEEVQQTERNSSEDESCPCCDHDARSGWCPRRLLRRWRRR